MFSAKRAGDYYMFEYDPSEDVLDESVETFVPEVTPGASDFKKLDPAQVNLLCIEALNRHILIHIASFTFLNYTNVVILADAHSYAT